MNTNHDKTTGKGFSIKNPPQVDCHAGSAIERSHSSELSQSVNDISSSSESSPSATASNIGITPAGQESGLGPLDQ